MSTTNKNVAEAWIAGKRAQSRSMSTDGRSIWSYGLMIGHVGPDSRIFIRNAQAPGRRNPGGKFYSKTTSCHVSIVFSFALFANQEFGQVIERIDDAKFEALVRQYGANV